MFTLQILCCRQQYTISVYMAGLPIRLFAKTNIESTLWNEEDRLADLFFEPQN